MKQIAITGGKGGTGKSTFAVLYALKLAREGKKVVLCDADVECPNDHLLLKAKLKKQKNIYAFYPKLDKKKCLKCGYCSTVCRSNAIFWVKGKYPLFIDELCSACGACWISCPHKAIKTRKQPAGEIFKTRLSPNLWLITGLSNASVTETGPIVRETRKFAEEFARKIKVDYLLIDSAAGLHCPVIASLIDVNQAFTVTEPTPLGEHDLKLVLELLKKLKVKAKIVINKADVGNKKPTLAIAKKHRIVVAAKIPYSRELIEAYSQGKLAELEGLI